MALKGFMTYAFTHMGNFLLPLLLPLPLHTPLPPASGPMSKPQGLYPSLKAQIQVLRPKSLEARIWALGLGFGPRLLEFGILSLRLGFGPQDWDFGLEAEI